MPTGKYGRHLWLRRASVVAGLAIFGLLLAFLPAEGPFAFDMRVMAWARSLREPVTTEVMTIITLLGNGPTLGLLTGVGTLLIFARSMRWAAFFAVAMTGTAALNQGLKWLIARTRPTASEALASAGGYAFPSGHAMGTCSLFLALFFVVRALFPRLQPGAAAVGGALAGLVGWSRVYLGVHYPTDVVAGWATSTAWVVLLQSWTHTADPRSIDEAEAGG
ncbi:MAG: phosphatase PAP2 family protein [Myxococcota bacterium]